MRRGLSSGACGVRGCCFARRSSRRWARVGLSAAPLAGLLLALAVAARAGAGLYCWFCDSEKGSAQLCGRDRKSAPKFMAQMPGTESTGRRNFLGRGLRGRDIFLRLAIKCHH